MFLQRVKNKATGKTYLYLMEVTSAKNSVGEVVHINKKVKSMTPPMNRIMAPMVDFLKERTEALGQLAEKMVIQNMSFTQLIKAAAGLVGFAISSPIALL